MNTMSVRHMLRHTLLLAVAAIGTARAQAPKQGCIELKTEASVEQEYTNEQGQKAHRLVPAGKVIPGGEVIWTVTAKNVCNKPVENVAIQNPVPEHMTYVADSAVGPGTEITYSLDGKTFQKAEAIVTKDASGATHSASPEEYRFIRWVFKDAFAPGALGFGRYRARVQ